MKATNLWIIALVVMVRLNFAQTANWRPVGPEKFPANLGWQIHGITRITQFKFHSTDPLKMYATAATGGLYTTSDGGNNWTNMGTDKLPRTNMASVCVDHTNDQVIYIGLGDPNYGNRNGVIHGIWKTTNGGTNWSSANTGIGDRMALDILMSPTDNNVLIAATDDGIWKTTDGGANWTQKSTGGYFYQMLFKPGSTSTLYAVNWKDLYYSNDLGETWTVATFPNNGATGYLNSGRIAVTPAEPNSVFLTFQGNFGSSLATPILKSTNSGVSFSLVKAANNFNLNGYDYNANGQGNYNYGMCVDPTNANIVYVVGHVVWKSTNGGATFIKYHDWAHEVHTDMHQIGFSPHEPTKLWNANDGGMWLSTNGSQNWTAKSNGLMATEIVHAAQSPIAKEMMSIGTQDNGELQMDHRGWSCNGGGDFYHKMEFDYLNKGYVYHLGDGTRKGLLMTNAPSMSFPQASTNNGNDICLAFNPVHPNAAFFGKNTFVYRTTNLGSAPPTWMQLSGSYEETIKTIEWSQSDPNVLYYVGTSGRFYRCGNAMEATPGAIHYSTAPSATNVNASIAAVKCSTNVVYLSAGSKVYRSSNQGLTWTNVSGSLPNVNILKIVNDVNTTDESMYICTGVAVYYKNKNMSDWVNYSTGLPTIATITDFMIFNNGTANSEIRVSYYGKSTWGANLYQYSNVPVASITYPYNYAAINVGSPITIKANAFAGNGTTISSVEFFNGVNSLGVDNSAPYEITLAAPAQGQYSITAKVTDNTGAFSTSPVSIFTVMDPVVTFYQHCNYDQSGYYIGLEPGSYTTAQLQQRGIQDNDISSIVDFEAGYKVTVYSLDNFMGDSLVLTANNTCLYPGPFNDVISSLRVTSNIPNQQPNISWVSPANGTVYTAPANITFEVSASDPDGTVALVEFYNNGIEIGEDASSPYTFTWNGIGNGTYEITAKVTDNLGGTRTTAPARTVIVNQLPTATITTPANNATFTAPANITLTATATDAGTFSGKVEFFNGAVQLGTAIWTSPYTYNWTNVAAGTYTITAKATDNLNGEGTSTPVTITVTNPNQLPTVSITAPANSTSYTAPATVNITADAADADGSVSKVVFYNGAQYLGEDATSPYSYLWTNVAAGNYTLTAVAFDNLNATTTSSAISIGVINGTNTNLALNKFARASSAENDVNNNASKAVDGLGVDQTRWSSKFQDPQWIMVDLGAEYSVNHVKITWEAAKAKDYVLQLSNDSTNWTNTTIKTVTNNNADVNDWTDVTVRSGRYIRMYGTARTTGYGYSIWELEVYGTVGGTNQSPTVNITAPANNATYTTPATVAITATASDADGSVSKVVFYNGAEYLGEDATSPFDYSWTNVAAGTYSITAVAHDNLNATTTSSAVSVVVNGTNQLPTVSITAPDNNTTYIAPATVAITATASDADGSVSKVVFFNGAEYLGEDATSPFAYSWTNVAAGIYSITAVAHDNVNATTTSSVVNVIVNANQPPTVTITAPANNATYTAPATVAITATASDADGSVSKVVFYNGAQYLGEDATSPFAYNWTNVAAGNYSITAVAHDNLTLTTTSSAVSVVVNAAVNQAPTVSITAPANNASFTAPASVIITATAADADGTISKVEFYNGAQYLGGDLTSPYSVTWTDVAAGNYALTAVAYDNLDVTTTSSVINISVVNPGNTNLALNKFARSSSNENDENNPASKAVDGLGVDQTRWSSKFLDPQWIMVDLGAVYTVNRVKITWEAAKAKDYAIQLSNDSTNWANTTIKTVTNNSADVNDWTDITVASGRYIRMYGTARTTGYGYSIWEFEVYGNVPSMAKTNADENNNATETLTELSVSNYPNPMEGKTTIEFNVPKNDHVSISIYNAKGNIVAEILNEEMPSGKHSLEWDPQQIAEGVYYCKVQVGDKIQTLNIVKVNRPE